METKVEWQGNVGVDWAPPEDSDADERTLMSLERAVMRKYKAFRFSWDVFFHWVLLCVCYWSVVSRALAGSLPYLAATILLLPVMHHFFMPWHESAHGNVAGCPVTGKAPGLGRFVEVVVGRSSSAVLGYPPMLPSMHMEHHRFTNVPGKDFQIIKGTFAGASKTVIAGVLAKIVFFLGASGISHLAAPFLMRVVKLDLRPEPIRGQMMLLAVLFLHPLPRVPLPPEFQAGAWIALACALDCWSELFFLWLLPQQLVQYSISMVFQWAPHYPELDVGRYRDTRITLVGSREPWRSIISYLVFTGHDYHALHHLYPRVPWTRLKRMYHDLEPILRRRGVRIAEDWDTLLDSAGRDIGDLAQRGADAVVQDVQAWTPETVAFCQEKGGSLEDVKLGLLQYHLERPDGVLRKAGLGVDDLPAVRACLESSGAYEESLADKLGIKG